MRLLALLMLTVFFVPVAQAQNDAGKTQELQKLDKKLKDTKESKSSLESDLKDIQKTLESSKGDLVKTAKAVQDNEKTLQRLDIKIKNLRTEKQALSTKLDADRASIANLILALDRINRIPNEALIASPESPYKTAQSAMLLEEILPALNTQAQELRDNLQRLQDISTDLDEKRAQVIAAAKELKTEQKRLNALVDQRTKLYASTRSDLAAEKKRYQKYPANPKTSGILSKILSKSAHDRKPRKNVLLHLCLRPANPACRCPA